MFPELISRLNPQLTIGDWLNSLLPARGGVREFEQRFAETFERPRGTLFSHGRVALYAFLKCLEIENSEIICPAYTCVVVPNAIVLSGNRPVFVDSTEDSFNMDLGRLEKAITAQTRAIVVTHLFGYPMDTQAVREIVERAEKEFGRKIWVIQDMAHSFGCRSRNELVSTSGDAAIFGLNISKLVTTVFGGMIITADAALDEKLKNYRAVHFSKTPFLRPAKALAYLFATLLTFKPLVYGLVNRLESLGLLNHFVKYYEDGVINFPRDWQETPSALEARVGLSHLKRYEARIRERQRNARKIREELAGVRSLRFLPDLPGATYSHCVGLTDDREKWVRASKRLGVQLGIIVEYSIPLMKAFKEYAKEECPWARYYSERTVNFPVWRALPRRYFEKLRGLV